MSLGANDKTVTVTFGQAFADTDYVINFSVRKGAGSPRFQAGIITAKSTTGFTVTWNARWNALDYTFEYLCVKF